MPKQPSPAEDSLACPLPGCTLGSVSAKQPFIERVQEQGRIGAFVQLLGAISVPVRFATVGAMCAGVVGAIVGLVVGLHVHAPTAWFAVLELGVPAGIIGAATGLLVGALYVAAQSAVRHIGH